jgi:hypothetical protein
MAASSRFVYPYVRAFESDNSVAAGWKLWFYITGTSTPQDTFNDEDLAPGHENSNPVVADADGQFGDIFLSTVADYKVVLTDESDVVVDTADPVAPPNVGAASTSTPGVIQIATQAQHLAGNTTNLATVPQYVANMIQQGFGYATMGGTGDVITATLAPVPAAYAPGMVVNVRMTATNTTAATLNVNGLGAIAVKKRNPSGATALTANDLISGIEYQFIYDSAASCFWVTEPSVPNVYAMPGTIAFTAQNNAATPNTKVDITAALAITLDSNNFSRVTAALSKTIDCGTTGANGLDAGALANTTWYYVFIVQKADGTVAGLMSTSATAPVMPSGYTFKTRVGAIITDASAHFLRFKQRGRKTRWTVAAGSNVTLLPLLVAPANSQTRTAIAIGNFAPPTATMISVVAASTSGPTNILAIAPNSDVGYTNNAAGLIAGPVPVATFLGGGASVESGAISVDLLLESTNIYYSSGPSSVGNTTINALGFEDAVPCW